MNSTSTTSLPRLGCLFISKWAFWPILGRQSRSVPCPWNRLKLGVTHNGVGLPLVAGKARSENEQTDHGISLGVRTREDTMAETQKFPLPAPVSAGPQSSSRCLLNICRRRQPDAR